MSDEKRDVTPAAKDVNECGTSSLGGVHLSGANSVMGRRFEQTAKKMTPEAKPNPNAPGTVDSADLLIGSGTPQPKKKGFFSRIFKK